MKNYLFLTCIMLLGCSKNTIKPAQANLIVRCNKTLFYYTPFNEGRFLLTYYIPNQQHNSDYYKWFFIKRGDMEIKFWDYSQAEIMANPTCSRDISLTQTNPPVIYKPLSYKIEIVRDSTSQVQNVYFKKLTFKNGFKRVTLKNTKLHRYISGTDSTSK